MKKIIVQGRPFILEPCGIKNFSILFFKYLARALPEYQFEILVSNAVDSKLNNLSPNIKFISLMPIEAKPEYLSTVMWENLQMLEYVKSIPKEQIYFYISPYNCLPITKLPVPEYIILHDTDLWADHGVLWQPERRFGYEIKKQSIYNADHIFTVSEFSKKQIMEVFNLPSTDVSVIYEDISETYGQKPTDQSQLLDKFGVIQNKYYLYVGTTEPRKNINLLLEAYNQYVQSHPSESNKLVLVLSENERTKNLSNKNISDSNIIKATNLTETELSILYKNAFAFIHPSSYEGFGLQILEAQASGTSLILSDIATFKEIAGDGAFYFPSNSSSGLKDAMVRLEKDSELKKDLINKGYINRNRFSWKKTVDTFLAQINKNTK